MFRSIWTIGHFKRFLYAIGLVCFVVLFITGFGPWLLLQKRLAGYWLMVHATFAPVFALCIAALAVMEAQDRRFDKSDGVFLSCIFRRRKSEDEPVRNGSVILMKVCFWLICVLALPLFLSSVLSMFPLFGTEGQEILFQTHRYSALLFSLAVIVYACLAVRKRAIK